MFYMAGRIAGGKIIQVFFSVNLAKIAGVAQGGARSRESHVAVADGAGGGVDAGDAADGAVGVGFAIANVVEDAVSEAVAECASVLTDHAAHGVALEGGHGHAGMYGAFVEADEAAEDEFLVAARVVIAVGESASGFAVEDLAALCHGVGDDAEVDEGVSVEVWGTIVVHGVEVAVEDEDVLDGAAHFREHAREYDGGKFIFLQFFIFINEYIMLGVVFEAGDDVAVAVEDALVAIREAFAYGGPAVGAHVDVGSELAVGRRMGLMQVRVVVFIAFATVHIADEPGEVVSRCSWGRSYQVGW